MKSPFTGGKTHIVLEPATFRFRNQDFEITVPQYECVDTKRRFTTGEQDDYFLAELHRQYRERNFIPAPEQIQITREQYSLSAARMSALLGMGTNQYARYEAGEMPTESNGTLLSLAARPEVFRSLVEAKRHLLKPRQLEKLILRLEELTHAGSLTPAKGAVSKKTEHSSVTATIIREGIASTNGLSEVDWFEQLTEGMSGGSHPGILESALKEVSDYSYAMAA